MRAPPQPMIQPPLTLVFMGTPEFAAVILKALIAAGHRIAAAYAQPPRPAGRGHRLQPSPVQGLAGRHGIPVRCPTGLRDAEATADFTALEADAAVVAAYGLILPPAILQAPRLGCINVHASLLPRWRGAAPVQRAILAGDRETGITVMQMDEGLDTGAILMQRTMPIGPAATGASLTDALAALGGEAVVDVLGRYDELTPRPQPPTGIVYAKKLSRDEAWLDWRLPAEQLERQVRAFDPWPGTFFSVGGERIRALAATAEPRRPTAAPGTVLDEHLSIACGNGVLRPTRMQRAGRAAQDAAAFLRGFAVPPGMVLPCPATS